MARWFAAIAALFFLAGAPVAAQGAAGCRLVRVAALDMGTDDMGLATIQAAIGGHPLTLGIDTGGTYTAFTKKIVDRLGLPVVPRDSSKFYLTRYALVYFGGHVITEYVRVDDFSLGALKAPSMIYPVIPPEITPSGDDGLLSPDFLAGFDADFDFAGAKLNLFSQDHCPGKVVYWTHGAVAVIPFTVNDFHQIRIHVTLDGVDIPATVDTGSTKSELGLEAAEALFHFTGDSPLLQKLKDAPSLSKARRYPFKQLDFDGVIVNAPDIVLFPNAVSKSGDTPSMLIGMNVLRQLHLYIAYGEKNLYVSAADAH